MKRGFVKLWRSILDGGLIKKHKHFVFMCWCLLKATHKPFKAYVGHQTVILQPGQFVFGRVSAAKELDMSERQIRSRIAYFERTGFLTSKTTSNFSVITIVNWSAYQHNKEQDDQQNDQQSTSNRPHTRIKEHKKDTPTESSSAEDPPTSVIPSCPHQEIIAEYNRILGPYLPEVIPHLWKGKRQKALAARWKERPKRQTIAWWTGLFEYIREACPFLLGKSDTEWKADLGWIVNAENIVKIIEGNYAAQGKHGTNNAGNDTRVERGGSDPMPGGCDEGGVDRQGQDQERTAGGMEAAA